MVVVRELMNNSVLLVSILSWAVAQIIKVIIFFAKNRKINIGLFISSGSMPSSHTSFVVAMTTAIGMGEGFDTPLFAISAVTSMVIMYDAAGVRRAAGKQAEVLNMLIKTFEETGLVIDKKLKELLGHSPIEVAAGALLGIVIAVIFA